MQLTYTIIKLDMPPGRFNVCVRTIIGAAVIGTPRNAFEFYNKNASEIVSKYVYFDTTAFSSIWQWQRRISITK